MAPHSSVLAWRIPGTGEPGGLPSMGSHRVGHDWSNLAAAAAAKDGKEEVIPNSPQSISIHYMPTGAKYSASEAMLQSWKDRFICTYIFMGYIHICCKDINICHWCACQVALFVSFSLQPCGILQARIMEWVAMPSSRGSSPPRDPTHVSYVSCIGR